MRERTGYPAHSRLGEVDVKSVGAGADLALLVGRILLVVIFLMSGWMKAVGLEGTIGYLASLQVPYLPYTAYVAVAAELGFAALIAVGLLTRWAALGLAVFAIVATALAHRFWEMPPEQQMIQSLMFWKNVGLIGGLLVLAGSGAGRFSIDGGR